MRKFFKYLGVFIVAVVVMQLIIFDSMHPWIYFAPLAYAAFIVLLPLGTRPISMLVLGAMTGIFVDFFEGTGGLHTAATLVTAYMRTWVLSLTLGRETVEVETSMPSIKQLGRGKFLRYTALVTVLHCLVFFSLEALSWTNFQWVLVRTFVNATITLLAVWMLEMLFTVRRHGRG
jgi:hypothetical protein